MLGFLNGWGGLGASVRHVIRGLPAGLSIQHHASTCECLPLLLPLHEGAAAVLEDSNRSTQRRGRTTQRQGGETDAEHRGDAERGDAQQGDAQQGGAERGDTQPCTDGLVASCWLAHAEPPLVVPIGVLRDRAEAAGKILRTPPRGDAFWARYGLSEQWPPPLFVPQSNGTQRPKLELIDDVHCKCPTRGGGGGGARARQPVTPTLHQQQRGGSSALFYRCSGGVRLVPGVGEIECPAA